MVTALVALGPGPASADEAIVSHQVRALQTGQQDYWTEEKLLDAKPFPTPFVSEETRKSHPETRQEGQRSEDTGVLLQDDSHAPEDPGFADPEQKESDYLVGYEATVAEEAHDIARVSEQDAFLSGGEERTPMANGYDYPPPHNTSPVYGDLYEKFPFIAVGRVFFTADSDGRDYSCSGASVGGKAVLTAAHCVSDGEGRFHRNWVFIPAYKNGSAPYGKWYANSFYAFDSWHYSRDLGRDVGFAVVNDREGKKLSEVVGYLGFSANAGRVIHWNVLGYPAAPPYDGSSMIETQASFAQLDSSESPGTNGIGTSQTGGSSGGPFVQDLRIGGSGACNHANGVVSYAYEDLPYLVYSPYFDTNVYNLKNTVIAK